MKFVLHGIFWKLFWHFFCILPSLRLSLWSSVCDIDFLAWVKKWSVDWFVDPRYFKSNFLFLGGPDWLLALTFLSGKQADRVLFSSLLFLWCTQFTSLPFRNAISGLRFALCNRNNHLHTWPTRMIVTWWKGARGTLGQQREIISPDSLSDPFRLALFAVKGQ